MIMIMKKILMKREWLPTREGGVYNDGCFHAVDDNNDDDISNCYDNGNRGDYFGVKVLMSMMMLSFIICCSTVTALHISKAMLCKCFHDHNDGDD